jgi:tetratricopeptide (TPR) repeat protein
MKQLDTRARVSLGKTLQKQGKISEALAVFQEVLRKDPVNVSALYHYGGLSCIEPDDPVVTTLETLSADPGLTVEHSALVKFTLAKIRLDQGEDEIAFALFKQANTQNLKPLLDGYNQAKKTAQNVNAAKTPRPKGEIQMHTTSMVERIGSVTLRNGIVRLQTLAKGADGNEKVTGEWAIPAGQYGPLLKSLQDAGKQLQEKQQDNQPGGD